MNLIASQLALVDWVVDRSFVSGHYCS